MSLFSSIQIANNALFAAQIGLQVTGNNIANANTPGYIRERVALTPAATQLIGDLPLGLGVEVQGIVQETDRFLTERLRVALSDLSNSETQEQTYLQLEALIGELSETDLSTSLNDFLAAVNDILNQPEDVAVRNLAVLQGQTVTDDIRRLDQRVRNVRSDINAQVEATAGEIDHLLQQIAELNVKIVVTEGGSSSESDAVGLRDQRGLALADLASLVGIRVVEQEHGSVSVFAGGEFLVFEGERRHITTSLVADRGIGLTTINIAETDAPLNVSSGKLAGMYAARDDILGGFIDQMESLSRTLAFEFNKLYSGGQGLTGFAELSGESAVINADTALDQAGLSFTPVNGSFQLLVKNTRSGTVETSDLLVKLNGLKDDTTLNDLAADLDAVDGISAAVTTDLQLRITSDSPESEFSFAQDTSGVLAALGLNVFFTGSTAGFERQFGGQADPSKFAASRGGIGTDTQNAVLLAGFADNPLDSQNGSSLSEFYENIVGGVAQASSVTKAVTDGFRVFHRTLEGEQLAISGVSLDDEAVQMITYQRMFQATARYIATISDLLETLVSL